MTRPLIIGMNNPHRLGDPLSPDFTAGRRLFEMSGMTKDQYLTSFERINLLNSIKWDMTAAREAATVMDLSGRNVLLLGLDVARAFGVEQVFWREQVHKGGRMWVVPHPSGLCQLYNSPQERIRLKRLLRSLLKD